jgi:hypothetical protein
MIRLQRAAVVVACIDALVCSSCNFNAVSAVCEDPPAAAAISLGTDRNTWLGTNYAADALPGGGLFVAFLSAAEDPRSSSDVWLGGTLVGSRTQGAQPACSADRIEHGIDREALDTGQPAAPRVVFAQSGSRIGALVYVLAASLDQQQPRSDDIRLGFLTSDGCIMSQDSELPFLGLERSDVSRILSRPQVAFLRDDEFVVTWMSASRSEFVFDDRVRARIVRPTWPHFPANARSTVGEAVDIPLDDRWIMKPTLVAIDSTSSLERRLALIWYARTSRSGTIKMVLLDEQLGVISSVHELDTDRDQDDALAYKSIAATYEPSLHSLFIVWSKQLDGKSVIAGRRVEVSAEPIISTPFEVTRAEDGDAFEPAVVVLKRDHLVFLWRRGAEDGGGVAVVGYRPDGARRFNKYSCGTVPATVGQPSAFNPIFVGTGERATALWNAVETAESASLWRIRSVTVSVSGLFVDD